MVVHKLTLTLVLAAVFAVPLPHQASNGSDDAPPEAITISGAHRAFLSRVARRTVRDVVLKRGQYEVTYAPAVLRSTEAEVVVRLRRGGYLLAHSAGDLQPIALAVRDAALAAARQIAEDETVDLDFVNRLLIEIEVIKDEELLPQGGDWTRAGALDAIIEPGMDGLVLVAPKKPIRFCPTELIAADQPLAELLSEVAKSSLSGTAPGEVPLVRFRTIHWYQPPKSDNVVSLHRGLTVIQPEDVTTEALDRSIASLADYMIYRQLRSGLFTYQYEAGQDRYTEDNSPIRQIGGVVALAVHARATGRSASRSAADLGVRYHLQGLRVLPNVERAAFLATADGRHRLGVSAMLCLALGEHPQPARYADTRVKLANAILSLQRPSGMFMTAFPPARDIIGQAHYPGEALLALATHYAHQPTGRVLDAFDRAIAFYRDYFRETPSPVFASWQLRAFAAMAGHTKRQDYAEYVFELADWIIERQIDAPECPWPELRGGITTHREGKADFTTAFHLEAIADALQLARSVNDAERISRYDRALRGAVRFVMQLQVRPEEAYFMRSPRDAVGGIRTGLTLNLLRIDHCEHALIGLIKARQVLYP